MYPDIDLFTFFQISHSLLTIFIVLLCTWLSISIVDTVFYFYHKWIRKDFEFEAVKTKWRYLK